jgi:hypothetical protein
MTRKPQTFGATGRYPEGKLNEDDEGELTFGLARDPDTGYVHINFGTPVGWLVLPPDQAIVFAEAIIKKARNQ